MRSSLIFRNSALSLNSIYGWLMTLLFMLHPLLTCAQQSAAIDEPAFGVKFKVPEGWQYQKNEAGYVFGHNSIPGIMLLSTAPYKNLEEIKAAAYEGIQDEGVTLQLQEAPQAFGSDGLAGSYEGIMNMQEAKAYAIALLHPYGGKTISGMIITLSEVYSKNHVASLEQLMSSIEFSKPVIPEIVKEWEAWFKKPGGCRLKYLTSSGSSSYDGGYTGSSAQATIDLCPSGSFSYSSSSDFSMSIDAGNAFSASSDDGNGTWTLGYNGANPVLELLFDNGNISEYEITYVDQKTYLNGTRYFVLFDQDGPGCY